LEEPGVWQTLGKKKMGGGDWSLANSGKKKKERKKRREKKKRVYTYTFIHTGGGTYKYVRWGGGLESGKL
jgi:hypothetical protein